MFDCHHLFGTFIASHKVRWEKWIAKREEKYRQFNAANYCRAKIQETKIKVALSQKILKNFFIAKINIPNHYPEQKI